MQNLAGVRECDRQVIAELKEAGVPMLYTSEYLAYEVPASVDGVLTKDGNIIFKLWRAWYYWVVKGDVPLEIAEELYADSTGRKDVRVAGHCGCPPPKDWARRRSDGRLVIDAYHIDSQAGLNLFVSTLRRHEVVD